MTIEQLQFDHNHQTNFLKIREAIIGNTTKEFYILNLPSMNHNDYIPMTIQDGLIGGKKHYAIETTTLSYNDYTQNWELKDGPTLFAFFSSIDDTPPANLLWDKLDGSQVLVYLYNYNQTSQQFIEDQKAYNLYYNNSQPQESTVYIESAQILAMGDTPIELLHAPGVGMYYDIEKVILEYTYVTTAYLLADETLMLSLDNELGFIFKDIITINIPGNPRYAIWSSNNPYMSTNGYIYVQPLSLNSSLTITSDNSSNPTLGDGTLRAIITYKVRTFGA